MADDQQKRDVAVDDSEAVADKLISIDLDADEQARLLQEQPQRDAATPGTSSNASTTDTLAPEDIVPQPRVRSPSSSPVKRMADAVAGAVSTAWRKAVPRQCCAKPTDDTSSEESSPMYEHELSPEELLKKTPEKPCLRRKSPSPTSLVARLKVSFTGVSLGSADESEHGSTCEGGTSEQHLPQGTPPGSSQPAQEKRQAATEQEVVIQVHPPEASTPEESSESSVKPETDREAD
ncbi:hypothetical protein HPB50_029037 [Hyalomma asiaticum]|nr:hypothetical protein HPB50_029037 [Hyalomma asiaticum]